MNAPAKTPASDSKFTDLLAELDYREVPLSVLEHIDREMDYFLSWDVAMHGLVRWLRTYPTKRPDSDYRADRS